VVALVCKRWHAVLYSTPAAWCGLQLSVFPGGPAEHLDGMQRQLQRVGGYLQRVRFELDVELDEADRPRLPTFLDSLSPATGDSEHPAASVHTA